MRGAVQQVLLLALVALLGCSPALNWRVVELGRLQTLLPCKPDIASRTVNLSGQLVEMQMAGCEATGVLFAISRVQAADATQAAGLLRALRQASLDNVRVRELRPVGNNADAQTSLDLLAEGQTADGNTLQARLKWLQYGFEIYQIAAYGAHLSAEQTEGLVNEARLRP
jgi:hypothetical protein